jgi:hypothetical protein
MDAKEIRRRIRFEEEDPDSEIGISVFVLWEYHRVGDLKYREVSKVLIASTDEQLEELWARFLVEADEEHTTKVHEVYEHPYEVHEPDCFCTDCQENRQAGAEWYREMRKDR